MVKDFITWLTEELNRRGWTNTELARRAKVAPSTVSMVISRQNNPGLKFCTGVARAFHMKPEDVQRLAGVIPPLPGIGEDASISRTLEVMKNLTPEERLEVLEYAIWRYERQQAG